MSKSLRLQLELDIHAVTCPGVWFTRKEPVFLSICFLGYHVKTKPFPPTFPFLFGDKFIIEKTFPGCATLSQLQMTLESQILYVELLQEDHSPARPHQKAPAPLVLATFETSGLEFLFPYPQTRPSYNSGVDIDLLMEPTREFPGIISPKIEASTRCHMNETRHAHLDQLHDNATTLNQVPHMDKHPHLGHRSKSIEDRDPFVWRRVDDNLIGRSPSADRKFKCDHTRGMRRSKSAVWGSGFKPHRRGRDLSSDSSGDRAESRASYSQRQQQQHLRGRSRERRHCGRETDSPSFNVHSREYYPEHYHVTHPPPTPEKQPTPPPPLPTPMPGHNLCQPYDPYSYHPPPPPPPHPIPPPPIHHPPPKPICPDPITCPYTCHVNSHPPPDPSALPPHLHSKSRLHHSAFNTTPVPHNRPPAQPPLPHHLSRYHYTSMPCFAPCCVQP